MAKYKMANTIIDCSKICLNNPKLLSNSTLLQLRNIGEMIVLYSAKRNKILPLKSGLIRNLFIKSL